MASLGTIARAAGFRLNWDLDPRRVNVGLPAQVWKIFNINRMPPAQQQAINTTIGYINDGVKPTGQLGKKWGAPYENDQGFLPKFDALGRKVTYTEYRVDPTPFGEIKGGPAGTTRIVVGTDGSRYFTNTHYGDEKYDYGKPFLRLK